MRRRISEAGVFELIKRKFPDDLWTKQSSEDEDELPTWGLMIQTGSEKAGIDQKGTDPIGEEYQVLRYADKTLCLMEMNPEDAIIGHQRPTPKQLEHLFDYVINMK